MLNISKRSSSWSPQQTILNRAFTWAGVSFLLICFLGLLSYLAMNHSIIGSKINSAYESGAGVGSMYDFKPSSGSMNLLSKLSLVSFGLIIITSIMQFIWIFRIHKASKAFIFSVYAMYIVGEGIAFGFLFLTLQMSQLFIVFGISGGLFITMAVFGYYAKDLSGMGKYLFAGSIFLVIFSIIMMILTLTGVTDAGAKFGVSAILYDVLFFGFGILMLGYIAYDVWRIKRLSQWAETHGMEKDERFRLTAYFGFRLLTDLISLIWIIARFLLRSQK